LSALLPGIEPRRVVLPGVGFRRRMMKKLLMMLALSGGLVLAACNTVHGATEDVSSVGDCVDGTEGNC
jgi:predicted small secreted protein